MARLVTAHAYDPTPMTNHHYRPRHHHHTTTVNQVMLDAPYGDYFVVLTKWVFGPPKDGADGCSLRLTAEINFHKDSWFKSQIQVPRHSSRPSP